MVVSIRILARAKSSFDPTKCRVSAFSFERKLHPLCQPSTAMGKHCSTVIPNQPMQRRWFETEREYHPVADNTLETIQDTIEEVLDATSVEFEINLASGVLTFSMPPHGTWVINKQTPNRQIWWSSPLSGPRRFEYDSKEELWFSTKDGLMLGRSLAQEIHHVHPEVEDFKLNV